jgi:hypothetical protein
MFDLEPCPGGAHGYRNETCPNASPIMCPNGQCVAETMGRRTKHGDAPTVHFTLIFNTFVMCTLFNELNARKLRGEFNVMEGITKNPIFCAIIVITLFLQVIFVQFGGKFVSCEALTSTQWLICVGIGLFSLPYQQLVVNPIARFLLNDEAVSKAGKTHKAGVLKVSTRFGDGHVHQYGKGSSGALSASNAKKVEQEVAQEGSIRYSLRLSKREQPKKATK